MPFPWWTLPPGIQLHPHNLENDFLVWITKISIWKDCATWILDVAFRYHQPSSWWLNHPPHPFEGHMRTVIIGSFPPRKSGWKFKKHLSCHQLAFHQRFFSTNGGMSAPKNEKKTRWNHPFEISTPSALASSESSGTVIPPFHVWPCMTQCLKHRS